MPTQIAKQNAGTASVAESTAPVATPTPESSKRESFFGKLFSSATHSIGNGIAVLQCFRKAFTPTSSKNDMNDRDIFGNKMPIGKYKTGANNTSKQEKPQEFEIEEKPEAVEITTSFTIEERKQHFIDKLDHMITKFEEAEEKNFIAGQMKPNLEQMERENHDVLSDDQELMRVFTEFKGNIELASHTD